VAGLSACERSGELFRANARALSARPTRTIRGEASAVEECVGVNDLRHQATAPVASRTSGLSAASGPDQARFVGEHDGLYPVV
jgi:hypothetical protein